MPSAGDVESARKVPLFPPLPLSEWAESKETLHRFAQIVGKIRLDQSTPRNHWWNVPFHLTGRGITTRPMGTDTVFTIDFDFVDHRLEVSTLSGDRVSFGLPGLSVAAFFHRLLSALGSLDIAVSIRPVPFDLPDTIAFAKDSTHHSYDPFWVTRYWQVLSQVALVLEEFAGRSYAKTSPVHHFWHTFDLAVTRFSDRRVPLPETADPVTREAYSHEVISAGFWFGDDQVAEPAFYSYTAPEPAGLTDQRLSPKQARWIDSRGAHMALLRYDDARSAADPRVAALEFSRALTAPVQRSPVGTLRRCVAPTGRAQADQNSTSAFSSVCPAGLLQCGRPPAGLYAAATPNKAAIGATASGVSAGAVTRSISWPSVTVTSQDTNGQQICSAAASSASSSATPARG